MQRVAAKSRTYGIPPLMLDIPRQVGPVPAGFVRHDRCENGRKLGKTDPGPRFRENDFIALVREKLEPGRAPQVEEEEEDGLQTKTGAYWGPSRCTRQRSTHGDRTSSRTS